MTYPSLSINACWIVVSMNDQPTLWQKARIYFQALLKVPIWCLTPSQSHSSESCGDVDTLGKCETFIASVLPTSQAHLRGDKPFCWPYIYQNNKSGIVAMLNIWRYIILCLLTSYLTQRTERIGIPNKVPIAISDRVRIRRQIKTAMASSHGMFCSLE